MQIKIVLTGSPRRFMAEENVAGAQAVAGTIRRKTLGMQKSLRKEILRAGLGQGLANALRSKISPPRGPTFAIEGRIFSKASVRRQGGAVDLLTVFEEGAVIRGRGRSGLAIPTDEARRLRPGRVRGGLRPQHFGGRRTLDFVPNQRGSGGRLVLRNDPEKTLFIIVPRVVIKPRLRFATIVDRNLRNVAELIGKDWDRRILRVRVKSARRPF